MPPGGAPPSLPESGGRQVDLPGAVPTFRSSRGSLRLSRLIAGVVLFFGGYAWGRAASYRPWGTGIAMAALGFAMVAVTLALGG